MRIAGRSTPWHQRRSDPHAVDNAIRLIEVDDGLFVLGADYSGRMLELLARRTDAEDLLVFHAMPLRPSSAKRYLP